MFSKATIRFRVTRDAIHIQSVTPQDQAVRVAIEIGLDHHGPKAFWRGVSLIREASTSNRPLEELELGTFLAQTVMHRQLYEQHRQLPGEHFVSLLTEGLEEGRPHIHSSYSFRAPKTYADLSRKLNQHGEKRVEPSPRRTRGV